MFKSNTEYTNRYGDKYYWEPVDENTYLFHMENTSMKHCRLGGMPYEEELDTNNLSFFDPSGGPFVELGVHIDNSPIKTIIATEEGFIVEVEQ